MADPPGRGTPLAQGPVPVVPPVVVEHGWTMSAHRSSAALRVADCTPMAKVAVRASPYGPVLRDLTERLGVPFGRAARDPEGVLVAGALPGGWIMLGRPGFAPALVDRLRESTADVSATATDVTHASVLLRLTGAAAADTLAKMCLMDVGDRALGGGTVARTALAGVTSTIIRDDEGASAQRSYLLMADRSYGGYLVDVLLDAGAEHGIEIDGFARR